MTPPLHPSNISLEMITLSTTINTIAQYDQTRKWLQISNVVSEPRIPGNLRAL